MKLEVNNLDQPVEINLQSVAKRHEIKMTEIRFRLWVWIQYPSQRYRFWKKEKSHCWKRKSKQTLKNT